MSAPKTLFDKIWQSHLVDVQEDGTCLIYIDRQVALPDLVEQRLVGGH